MVIEIDLSQYATKSDWKGATGINTLEFSKNIDLASLKLNVHKLDIFNLKTVTTNLRKLINVADNDVVKKTMFEELVTRINTIDSYYC